MDGVTLTQIVDNILKERGISRLELCEAIGITNSAYTNWKNGSKPRADRVKAIEEYLGINFSDYSVEKSGLDSETALLLEMLRRRPDIGTLAKSASDLPPSSVYALIADIEKGKENERKRGLSD